MTSNSVIVTFVFPNYLLTTFHSVQQMINMFCLASTTSIRLPSLPIYSILLQAEFVYSNTVFIILVQDDFMIMSSPGVCSGFFVACLHSPALL